MTATTTSIVDHHLRCIENGDLAGFLTDYADDAVLINPSGIARGLDAITPTFREFLAEINEPDARLTMLRQEVYDDVAYFFWTAETKTHRYPVASDTLVIRDGKIVAHTWAGTIEKTHPSA